MKKVCLQFLVDYIDDASLNDYKRSTSQDISELLKKTAPLEFLKNISGKMKVLYIDTENQSILKEKSINLQTYGES